MKSETEPKKKPRPLKLKRINSMNVMLWRRFALFAFGVIVVIALVCYGVLGNAILSQTKKRVRAVGEDLVATVGNKLLPPEVTYKKISDYALLEGMDVFMFTEGGRAVFGEAFASQEVVEEVYAEVEAKAGEWQDGKVTEFSAKKDNRTSFNYVACVEYLGLKCKLLVRYPVAPIAESVKQMELYVTLTALVVFVVAFFVSYALANKLSEPIRDISNTARKLAVGDYSVQFNSMQYSEIAKLSDSLNYMKEEIKKSDDFQKELLANVSHDLKTPLTMIKAYASMIREISGDDPEKRDKHLQVIIDESDRLTGLVNDILSTSKISAGIDSLNKKVFNFTELLYGVINSFSYLQETHGYTIMVDVDPNLYTFADEEKIKQVVYNLVSNAVNYTGEDKTVYISLKFEVEDGRIKFAVRDTGKGIGEDELAHIWDRYYRSKDSHTRPVKGTGLGLNIVKIILKSHAFEFGVNSKEGEGSTFFVYFPSVPSVPEEEVKAD